MKNCIWKLDPWHGYYDSACGHAYVFEHEFTVGSAYAFCPGCGKPIELAPVKAEPEVEE